jgi:UDP-N-acetylmuramoylalanine--D-glutamate ligase
MDVRGKRVLVVGLARSGFSAALALARRGAVVTVTDLKSPSEFRDLLPQLVKGKVGLELGSQRQETFLRQEVIVISPGVPWDLPQLEAARRRLIPIYPEVEAATWFLEGTLVGITGSNGKTTTTALLGDMLRASRFPTFVGGNIGTALSSAVDHASPGTMFVTELSSFQLEGIQELCPHVAVVLNLSPNHLDRHPNLEAYAQAKRQIFHNQRFGDFAILNADDPWVAALQATVPSQPVLFSRQRELASGVFVSGGRIYYRLRHLERALFETRDVALRGDFNLENVLAATAAACVLGADFAAIRKALREFRGVEHRLEFVGEIKGVDFYNNSKATSVDATVKSLEAFERGVHLILGGKDKGAPYTPLIPLIKERVRQVLLIGAAAREIARQLSGSGKLVHAGDLATAVREAFVRSRPGDTVLLAPACSSFDQFKDYEQRGRVFKELVRQLAKEVSTGAIARRKFLDVAAQEPRATRGVEALPAESPGTDEPTESSPTGVEPALHHPELHYAYEVETVEMARAEMEAQVPPEEGPAIALRASETEVVADEPLPFETRAGLAAVANSTRTKETAKGKGRGRADDHQEAPRSSAKAQNRLPGLD